MSRVLVGAAVLGVAAFSAQVTAQQVSNGESSEVMSCFYECKEGPMTRVGPTFQEITTLMIANQSPQNTAFAVVGILDGNQNVLAHTELDLSPMDLDELNICHTLVFANIPPPPAGLIEVVTLTPPAPFAPVYGWVKNVIGKFFVEGSPEPFEGRVSGVAKTECRLAPRTVAEPELVFGRIVNSPRVPPVLVEKTDP